MRNVILSFLLVREDTKTTWKGLKGLCHVMNICLEDYNNKEVLSDCADCFYNFLFLFEEKIKFKVLACSFKNCILSLKIVPVTRFKDLTHTENAYRKPPVIM